MSTNGNGPRPEDEEPIPIVPPLPPEDAPGANDPGVYDPGAHDPGANYPGAHAPGANAPGAYTPPGAGGSVPPTPGAYGPPTPGAYGPTPGAYGPPGTGGYPYGSGGYQPGMMPPPVEDRRPGIGWGILGGVLVVVLCILFFVVTDGAGGFAGFAGITLSFAVLPIVATALVIPYQTRKIGQGMFIVLGATPLIWFGVCVSVLTV